MQKMTFWFLRTAQRSEDILMQTAKDLVAWIDNERTKKAKQKIGKFITMLFCLPKTEIHEKIYEMFCLRDKEIKIEIACNRKRKEMQETLDEKIQNWDVNSWAKLLESYYWYKVIQTNKGTYWLYVGIWWTNLWTHIIRQDEHKELFHFFVDKWPKMSTAKKADWSLKTLQENFWM